MGLNRLTDRLAVCSWSLTPESPAELIDRLNQIGLNKVQLELQAPDDSIWRGAGRQLADAGIQIVSGMIKPVGEDYTSLESIRRTGGLVPDETWPQTWALVPGWAETANALNISLATFHVGFLPEDQNDPVYGKLLDRIGQVADTFAAAGVALGFETGQESAVTLNRVLDRLGRDDIYVNFDPANIILYNMGDPIEELQALGPRIRQCHIKDATYTAQPGTWGAEVVVGTGQVDWPGFFGALDAIGFDGYLPIEREAGGQRVADIARAKKFVQGIDG